MRLTPSQESVYRYVGKSTRWLTAYEISMLTGVSLALTKQAIKELIDGDLVEVRKRIGGFENGEREIHAKSVGRLATICDSARAQHQTDRITGVVPLAKRLKRIMGKSKFDQYAEFLK